MLYRDPAELDVLLAHLRLARGDHQWVEAKRSHEQLPRDLWTTLSAFANDGGGVVLLGVDELSAFRVTGVQNPAKLQAELGGLCERMSPPLRPTIDIVTHPDGAVVVAQIPQISRPQQPCHYPDQGGPHDTSYIRVGDADMRMTRNEVEDLLSTARNEDMSRRSAPTHSALNTKAVAALFGEEVPARDGTLQRQGIISEDGTPTWCGWLALGDHPQDRTALARVACRRTTRHGDPAGTRQVGEHVEGTVGELLDATLDWLKGTLTAAQVFRDGQLLDELDVPIEALRETVSNALIHRSFTPAMESTMISVEVSTQVVSVSSPGGLHLGVDLKHLGVNAQSAPRNYALVRLAERLRTPTGARIVESQTSGIARADIACHRARAAPVLFDAHPARVTVLALRGELDTAFVARAAPEIAECAGLLRVAAFALRLQQARESDPASALHRVWLDATVATRLLAPARLETGLRALGELVDRGLLVERPGFNRSTWTAAPRLLQPASPPPVPAGAQQRDPLPTTHPRTRRKQVPNELLRALAEADANGLSARELARMSSALAPSTVRKHLTRALEAELIQATTDSPHDPNRRYILTALGSRQLGR